MPLIQIRPLEGAKQTGREMYRLARQYYMDLAPYADYDLQQIYDKVKYLPFNPDPVNVEYVKRPKFTLERFGPGGDCDDKSVVIGAWAELTGHPYRFIAVGNPEPGKKYSKIDDILLTHVLTLVKIMGKWVIVDPTYAFNVLGYTKSNYVRKVVLEP